MLLVGCVILTGFLQTIGLIVGVNWLIGREKRLLQERLLAAQHEWFTPPAEGQPHKAAVVLDAAGSVVGAAAARSIMASLSADASHAARAANGMADELQGRANPLLGLLAGGKRGKGAAMMRLAEVLGPMLQGKPSQADNGHDGGSVRSRLQRGG